MYSEANWHWLDSSGALGGPRIPPRGNVYVQQVSNVPFLVAHGAWGKRADAEMVMLLSMPRYHSVCITSVWAVRPGVGGTPGPYVHYKAPMAGQRPAEPQSPASWPETGRKSLAVAEPGLSADEFA